MMQTYFSAASYTQDILLKPDRGLISPDNNPGWFLPVWALFLITIRYKTEQRGKESYSLWWWSVVHSALAEQSSGNFPFVGFRESKFSFWWLHNMHIESDRLA